EELARVAVDEAARAAWAERGFRNAARFTADAMLDRYEELYAELAALSRR
ncbi:MAG: glycosyltransferase family 1 protein, partial [Gluconacetobacter diazotrophicus]|nr:glycosyltransferase family 1 protein [Gluconacetobacter diazotrophicus]